MSFDFNNISKSDNILDAINAYEISIRIYCDNTNSEILTYATTNKIIDALQDIGVSGEIQGLVSCINFNGAVRVLPFDMVDSFIKKIGENKKSVQNTTLKEFGVLYKMKCFNIAHIKAFMDKLISAINSLHIPGFKINDMIISAIGTNNTIKCLHLNELLYNLGNIEIQLYNFHINQIISCTGEVINYQGELFCENCIIDEIYEKPEGITITCYNSSVLKRGYLSFNSSNGIKTMRIKCDFSS